MKQLILVIALVLAPAAALAQAVPAVQAGYVARTILDGEVIKLEEGTHVFAEDGRRRHERRVNGERTAELLLPGREQIHINYTLGVVQRAPAGVQMPLLPRMEDPSHGQRLQLAAPPAYGEVVEPTLLGEQARGPLLLHGFRVEQANRFFENWLYFPDGRGKPFVEMESVLRQTTHDGHEVIVEKQLLDVMRTTVDASLFNVPEGLVVKTIHER